MTDRPRNVAHQDPGTEVSDHEMSDHDTPTDESRADQLFRFVQARDPEALKRWVQAYSAEGDVGAGTSSDEMRDAPDRTELPESEQARNSEQANSQEAVNKVPPGEAASDEVFSSQMELGPGSPCGPFHIERKLGRGGMGNVYLATRADDLDLQVALKTLNTWNPKMMSLFRKECKILSGLQHTNIAHLIDAGVLPSGQPWLAMEYVAGQTLDVYLAKHDLDLKDRLQLFLKICDALSHAHQHMVIHRDLKPRNIMVGPEGEPKLLDFDIAAVLNPDTGEQQTVTALSTPMMTPEYASPEQVNGQRLSAASDVYSLGVLFYEMLTGQRPYRMNPRNLARVMHAVNEAPITRPSRVRGKEGEATGRFTRQLRGDLDTIALKALERDLKRRYASVEAFAADVRAYLRGLPIEARPATTLYRFRKFVLRNPWPLSLASGLVLFLVVFSVYAAHQQRVISREKRTAEHVTDFLVSMFEQTDPNLSKNREVSAFEVMENGRRQLETGLIDEPEVKVRLMATMGKVYRALGHLEQSQALFESAVEKSILEAEQSLLIELELIRTLQLRGNYKTASTRLDVLEQRWAKTPNSITLMRINQAQGRLWFLRGNYIKSKAAYDIPPEHLTKLPIEEQLTFRQERAELESAFGNYQKSVNDLIALLKIKQELYGKHHLEVAVTYALLGTQYTQLGDHERAIDSFNLAELVINHLFENQHPYLINIQTERAVLFRETGNYSAAKSEAQIALEKAREVFGSKHPLIANNIAELSGLYKYLGDINSSEALRRESLRMYRDLYGETHKKVAEALKELAKLHQEKGEYLVAESLFHQALSIDYQTFGKRHPYTANRMDAFAGLLHEMGEYDKAETMFRHSLEIFRETLGEYHPDTAVTLHNLAAMVRDRGDYVNAEKLFADSVLAMKIAFHDTHPHYATTLGNFAKTYLYNGNYKKAETLYYQSLSIRQNLFKSNHPRIANCLRDLGILNYYLGNYQQSKSLLNSAVNTYQKTLGANHKKLILCNKFLGRLYHSTNNLTRAEYHFRQALKHGLLLPKNRNIELISVQAALANLLSQSSQISKAKSTIRKIEAQITQPQNPLLIQEVYHVKARLLIKQKQLQEAENRYRDVLTKRREILRPKHPLIADTLIDLSDLLADMGQSEEALPMIEEAATIYADCLPPEHEFHQVANSIKGHILHGLGQQDQAQSLLRAAHQALADRMGEDHYLTLDAKKRLERRQTD
ncbi:Non-specific serine/threonine protein kinase [Sulfidibacter corallicola]|uniref:Tetratricopeptide repeat protein n=1 Tax=Sulfidibacter corallicola TaxID=2818388 RepID=A0A8A4TH73_SULCO|nr:serine/threonine-protein kinase [Sulfidibacter corallicola]QTD48554.1 tetratricopeptide repeat protein [Sulfidibacter corallicola]